MAHLLDFSNNRANMAYVGDKPWHGLGTALPLDQPLETWRIAAGLDFEYRLASVNYLEPALPFPNRFVVYRSDTLEPLSVVSNNYHTVQPSQILEFFRDLTEEYGFTLETAGSLKGGTVIWALAKTGRTFDLGHDEVKQYTLLMTSCDTTLATRATLTSIRVVCNNTLTAALRQEAANLIVTSHASQFDADAVKANLGLVENTWDEFADAANQMALRPLKDVDAKEAILAIFGDPDKPVLEQPNQRAMAQVLELYQGGGQGAYLPSSRNTVWGLLNAVTEYQDHHAIERKPGARLASAWMGAGATIKRKAFDRCLKLAA